MRIGHRKEIRKLPNLFTVGNLHFSSFDLFVRKQRWFWSSRRGLTTRSQTTVFGSCEKSYTFREDVSAMFLNAMNTEQLQY